MNRLFCSILVCYLLLSVSHSLAQYQIFETIPQDARCRSLGKTETLTSSGGNALFCNPGLLGTVYSYMVNTSASYVSGNIDHKSGANSLTSIHEEGFRFNSLSFAYPIIMRDETQRIILAAGYQRYVDLNTRIEYRGDDSFLNDQDITYENGLHLGGVGISYAASSRLAFGVSVAHTLAEEMKREYYLLVPGQRLGNTCDVKMTMFTFGLYGQLHKDVMISFIVRPRYRMKISNFLAYSTGETSTSNSLPLYTDAVYRLPAMTGVGIQARPWSKLFLYAELQTRDWGNMKSETQGQEYSFNCDLGFAFRIAAEWRADTPIRLGFYNEEVAIPYNQSIEKRQSYKTGITAGTVILAKHFIIEPYIDYNWLTLDNLSGIQNEFSSAYMGKSRASNLTIGVGFSWIAGW